MRDRIFRHNLTSHFLAALLAVLLWAYVKTGAVAPRADLSRTFPDVALEVKNIASGLEVTSSIPTAIAVTVRGTAADTKAIAREDFLAYLDLGGARSGTGQYVVRVTAPAGLSASANPSRIEVTLEKLITVDTSIAAVGDRVILGNQLLVATYTPKFVSVTGSESKIAQLNQAVVQTDWQQLQPSATISLPILLYGRTGQQLSGLQLNPSVVEASLLRYNGKRLDVNVVTTGELPAGVRLIEAKPETTFVIAYGPPEVLARLESINTEPLDLAAVRASGESKLDLVKPEGVLAIAADSIRVQVRTAP